MHPALRAVGIFDFAPVIMHLYYFDRQPLATVNPTRRIILARANTHPRFAYRDRSPIRRGLYLRIETMRRHSGDHCYDTKDYTPSKYHKHPKYISQPMRHAFAIPAICDDVQYIYQFCGNPIGKHGHKTLWLDLIRLMGLARYSWQKNRALPDPK